MTESVACVAAVDHGSTVGSRLPQQLADGFERQALQGLLCWLSQ